MMPSIERRVLATKISWRATYRSPDGRQCSKSFDRKKDAEKFLTGIENAKLTGTYVDPSLSRVTIGEWSVRWLAAQGQLKSSTRERYAGIVRQHVLPRWKSTTLSAVSHADIQGWVSDLAEHNSASTAVKAHRVLSLMLGLAVRDGRLLKNPADDVALPREVESDRRYLTHAEGRALADAAGANAAVIMFLAYTGMRFGEVAALRVRRLDLDKRQVEVAESVTAVNGVLVWSTPKGHARRRLHLPRFVAGMLGDFVAGKSGDDLLFTSRHSDTLRSTNFRRDVFGPAARKAGLVGLTPHALRHTAASLAIASGADVKVVQQMLGHKSATMTLDLYGHLFESRLGDVADALDVAAIAGVAKLLPSAQVFDLDERRRRRMAQ